jgi:hypothetical protein
MSWDTPRVTGDVYEAADHNTTIDQIKAKALLVGGTLDGTTIAGATPLKFGLTPTVVDPLTQGSIYWKASSLTPTVQCDVDVEVPIGQKEVRRVYNPSASTIAKGAAVYTLNTTNGAGVVAVALAQANLLSTSDVLGLVAAPILPLAVGWVVVRGTVSNLNTSGYSAVGVGLYLDAITVGALTETLPISPNFECRVGRVLIKDGSNGRINVRIFRTLALDNLADVSVPSPVANQLLKFNGVSWVAADSSSVSSAGGTDLFPTGNHALPIEGMSVAAVCEVTYTAHGMASGASVFFRGITQANWTILNSTATVPKKYVITVTGLNTFTIPVNSQTFGAYVPATDPGTYAIGKWVSAPDTTITTQTDSADSTGNTEVLMAEFVTPLPLGRTDITGGEWGFKTWCYSSSATDTNVIVIHVAKMATNGTIADLFTVTTADLGTTTSLSQISSVQPAYTILATDRLVIQYWAKSDRGTGVRSLYMTHNGTTNYSYVKTPISLGHASLGQLTYATAGHTGFAPIDAPTFTGIPAAATAAVGTDTTQLATTAFVKAAKTIYDYVTLYATGAMIPKTYPPAVFDQDETSTNKNNFVYGSFPTSDNNTNLQWLVNFPADWSSTGNIEATFIWTGAAGSGTVLWQLYGLLFPDSALLDTAVPQIGADVEDTYLHTGDLMVSPATTAAPITSVGTGGNTAIIKVKRNSGTKAEAAQLIAVRIKFIRTLA